MCVNQFGDFASKQGCKGLLRWSGTSALLWTYALSAFGLVDKKCFARRKRMQGADGQELGNQARRPGNWGRRFGGICARLLQETVGSKPDLVPGGFAVLAILPTVEKAETKVLFEWEQTAVKNMIQARRRQQR